MLEKMKKLLLALSEIKNQELSQALVRLGLVVVVFVYLYFYYKIFPAKEVVMPFIWAVNIYFVYSLLLITHILFHTSFNQLRHYISIVLDMGLLCVGMYAGDIASAFFYGGYYWLILGNGLRFGQHSLYISVGLAVVSFLTVINITEFWLENLALGWGLMIWLLLLPLYIGKLIKGKERALVRAQMADNAKSRFLANMSHELRTPLNGILGYSQMIHEEDIDIDEAKYAAKKVDKSATHLLCLINELLDMASIEAGKMKVSMEEVELLPLINEVMSLVIVTADEHNIQLDFESISEQSVYADRLRLKQVLVNLITNAIKYNSVNGCVSISSNKVDDSILIRVCDEGPGLSKEEQYIIFNPFERLSANPSNVEGAGIGLMITKNLVTMMGGEIGIESEKGSGSCFWIRMPTYTETPETTEIN